MSKFTDWYSQLENRATLNKRRRTKYKKDKKYRAKALAATRKWRKSNPDRVRKVVVREYMTIGEAAEKIGCYPKTIRNFEKYGLIPKHSNGKTHRKFFPYQVELIRAIANFRENTHYSDAKYKKGLSKLQTAAFKKW